MFSWDLPFFSRDDSKSTIHKNNRYKLQLKYVSSNKSLVHHGWVLGNFSNRKNSLLRVTRGKMNRHWRCGSGVVRLHALVFSLAVIASFFLNTLSNVPQRQHWHPLMCLVAWGWSRSGGNAVWLCLLMMEVMKMASSEKLQILVLGWQTWNFKLDTRWQKFQVFTGYEYSKLQNLV